MPHRRRHGDVRVECDHVLHHLDDGRDAERPRTHQQIATAQQAAEALRPLAGAGAYRLFTLGLIGTGMLAVPVLAGSCAYAIAEAAAWRGSLDRRPRRAKKFCVVLAVAMVLGSR